MENIENTDKKEAEKTTDINENKELNIINKDNEFSLYGYVKTNYKNIFIVILLIVLAVVYINAHYKLKKTERTLTERYNNLYEAAQIFSADKDTYYLELLAQAFSYAVLSEMTRNNFENIAIYATALLKNDKNMVEVIVSDEDGEIIISTNKKYENTSLRDYFLFNYFSLSSIAIIPDSNNEQLLIVAPLKALNQDRGYLIFRYTPLPFILEEK